MKKNYNLLEFVPPDIRDRSEDGDTELSIDSIGKNKHGMITLFRATMVHIFGLQDPQVDMVLRYIRSIGVSTLDMQEDYVSTNQQALYLLKSALKKEIEDEQGRPGIVDTLPDDEDLAGEEGMGAEESELAPAMESKKLLDYFRELS